MFEETNWFDFIKITFMFVQLQTPSEISTKLQLIESANRTKK